MLDCVKIGEYLRAVRQRFGYTQIELAKRLNISDKAVSRWESGLSLPDMDNMYSLSKIYGITVDDILSCNYLALEELCAVSQRSGEVQRQSGSVNATVNTLPSASATQSKLVKQISATAKHKDIRKTATAKFMYILLAAYFSFGMYTFVVAKYYVTCYIIATLLIAAVMVLYVFRFAKILSDKSLYISLTVIYGVLAVNFLIGFIFVWIQYTDLSLQVSIGFAGVVFLLLIQSLYAASELAGNKKLKFRLLNIIIAASFTLFSVLVFRQTLHYGSSNYKEEVLYYHISLFAMLISFCAFAFCLAEGRAKLISVLTFAAFGTLISFVPIMFMKWYFPESIIIPDNLSIEAAIYFFIITAFAFESILRFCEDTKAEHIVSSLISVIYMTFAVWLGIYTMDALIANFIFGGSYIVFLPMLRMFVLLGMLVKGVFMLRFDKLTPKKLFKLVKNAVSVRQDAEDSYEK